MTLIRLNQTITKCRKCPRLAKYIQEVASKKVRRFQHCDYWGKPVPGFGDPDASLLIIGLAPAAHGANRTGRMFTGDDVGRNVERKRNPDSIGSIPTCLPMRGLIPGRQANKNWLYRALYETGFANKPESISADDGLILKGAYITAIARCAPPQNKPTLKEIDNCAAYLLEELKILKNVNTILCLGQLAFRQYCKLQNVVGLKFFHGAKYEVQSVPGTWDRGVEIKKTLIVSYHPSRQNTNTGRLTWEMWINIFMDIKKTLSLQDQEKK
ncbi:MAG: uracil-DNA glycosylase [Bacteroidetes bacterium]|nr:uracil-DNA glycosylase [Bacteroidota bacterium]